MKSIIEASLATLPGYRAGRDRRHELLTDCSQSLLFRFGAALAHETVVRCPRMAAAVMGVARNGQSYQLVGEGFDSVVIRPSGSGEVLKVHNRTAQMTHDERQREAMSRKSAFAIVQQGLGNLVVDQSTGVEGHPFFPSVEVVVTRQPFIPHEACGIFVGEEEAVDQGRVEDLVQRIPNAANDLRRLVEASQNLYATDRLVPDCVGDNLVLPTEPPGILLIDGHPITPQYSEVQASTLRGLDRLASALDGVS